MSVVNILNAAVREKCKMHYNERSKVKISSWNGVYSNGRANTMS
jgi:hypothetical protein